jgi:hypothetical protein
MISTPVTDQLGRKRRQAAVLSFSPPKLDHDIAAVDIPSLG